MIVLLNGASSSGKTSLGKALQRRLPAPHLLLGIDTVVFALPGRWLDPPLWHEVFVYEGAGDDLRITAGPVGDRLVHALHRLVDAVASAGWDVIVDHVLLDPRWVSDAERVLGRHPLLRVGVRCPTDELVRRERERADRTIGQARAQAEIVHAAMTYDLEIDTSTGDPDACAATVATAIAARAAAGAVTGAD